MLESWLSEIHVGVVEVVEIPEEYQIQDLRKIAVLPDILMIIRGVDV